MDTTRWAEIEHHPGSGSAPGLVCGADALALAGKATMVTTVHESPLRFRSNHYGASVERMIAA